VRVLRSLSVLALSAAVLLPSQSASPAWASEPTTVSVRVEGESQTLLRQTSVTTTPTAVFKGTEADSCPGTNAIGALSLATEGEWEGKWEGGGANKGRFEGLGYAVETIDGETHAAGGSGHWKLWINNMASAESLCEAELSAGDQIVLFPCEEAAKECPTPLIVQAPTTANVDETVNVTVSQYNPEGEVEPAVGADVSGGGVTAKPTEIEGHTTMQFAGDGTYTLHVDGSGEQRPSVRTEMNICVHEYDDGTCGTPTPQTPKLTINPGGPCIGCTSPATPVALSTKIAGIKNGHRYSRRAAPRILRGSVSVSGATLQEVQIRLQRKYKGHCFDYSGRKEEFVRAKCSAAPFFSIGARRSFGYLLPWRLPAGRYLYALRALGGAGRVLIKSQSHIVFYVG
jgi:hypothetical protein